MAEDDIDDRDEYWPRDAAAGRDTHVVAAVHGAHHAVMRRLRLSTVGNGFDPVECVVLATLARDHGASPLTVRRRVGLHRSTMSSVLDRLERDGLVVRERSRFDGRRHEVRLTRTGSISAGIASVIVGDVEAEIAGYTSPAHRRGAVAVYEACVAIGHRERGVSF